MMIISYDCKLQGSFLTSNLKVTIGKNKEGKMQNRSIQNQEAGCFSSSQIHNNSINVTSFTNLIPNELIYYSFLSFSAALLNKFRNSGKIHFTMRERESE